MRVKFWILFVLGMLATISTASANIITVNSAEDSQIAGDHKCTLREAIQNSAQNVDTTNGDCAPGEFNGFGFNPPPITKDKIYFNIPGPGPHVIQLTSMLGLAFLEQVDIDARTQPGANCGTKANNFNDRSLKVILDGSSLPAATEIGVKLMNATISRPDVYKIYGLVFRKFPKTALYVGASKNYSEVACNNIGVDVDNVTVQPNQVGLHLSGIPLGGMMPKYGEFVKVSENIISGNTQQGILIENVGKGLIRDNLIGVKPNLQLTGNGGTGIDFVALSYLPNPNPGGTNGLWSIKGNTIAGNDAGIVIRSGRFITLSENSIYDNVKPAGIDLVQRFPLGQQGVTLNDANDVDNWNGFNSNHGLNYPVLTAATLNATGTTLTVNGTLDDNPEFGIKKRIEIFANPAPLPVGKREGRIYLGSADIVTDNLPGPKAFVLNINIPVGIPAANINNIVAVTTEREIVFVPPPYGISPYLNMPEPPFPTADYLNFVGFAMPMGSSSEFSAPLAVIAAGGGNPPPVPWNPVPPPVDPKAGVIPVKPTSAQ